MAIKLLDRDDFILIQVKFTLPMKERVGNEEDVSSNLEFEKLRWFSRSRI